eukprot:CAMPEP_0170142568 /NCGR_PEP_ID=MMETSP0033_2-20121228/7712_1 /TAXON_ID=195969 /ORGANISM="Dolichomastix tenuilepis, Strain CCMP3274" /LENGTH=289 /DNA_ID=CAMNT_0010378909 /DNA_START=25 /DNA_END=890 /DNA_ORIENTATION=+
MVALTAIRAKAAGRRAKVAVANTTMFSQETVRRACGLKPVDEDDPLEGCFACWYTPPDGVVPYSGALYVFSSDILFYAPSLTAWLGGQDVTLSLRRSDTKLEAGSLLTAHLVEKAGGKTHVFGGFLSADPEAALRQVLFPPEEAAAPAGNSWAKRLAAKKKLSVANKAPAALENEPVIAAPKPKDAETKEREETVAIVQEETVVVPAVEQAAITSTDEDEEVKADDAKEEEEEEAVAAAAVVEEEATPVATPPSSPPASPVRRSPMRVTAMAVVGLVGAAVAGAVVVAS